MLFTDLIKPVEDDGFYSNDRKSLSEEIKKQTRIFEANGGKVKYCYPGETANSECAPAVKNEYTSEKSISEYNTRMKSQKRGAKARKSGISNMPISFDGENRNKKKSKYGENIRKVKHKDGSEYYIFRIAGEYFGSGKNWDHDECIRQRNIVYVRRGKSIPCEKFVDE